MLSGTWLNGFATALKDRHEWLLAVGCLSCKSEKIIQNTNIRTQRRADTECEPSLAFLLLKVLLISEVDYKYTSKVCNFGQL